MSTDGTVTDEVRRILRDILDVELPSDDANVFETGRLDSLALVQVIFAIEQELGVTVPLGELDIEDFRSVRAIATIVDDLRAGELGPGVALPPGA